MADFDISLSYVENYLRASQRLIEHAKTLTSYLESGCGETAKQIAIERLKQATEDCEMFRKLLFVQRIDE